MFCEKEEDEEEKTHEVNEEEEESTLHFSSDESLSLEGSEYEDEEDDDGGDDDDDAPNEAISICSGNELPPEPQRTVEQRCTSWRQPPMASPTVDDRDAKVVELLR